MTIDERLHFLLQSTESLHSNLQELGAAVHELRAIVHEQSKTVQTDGEHIRALARIAEIH